MEGQLPDKNALKDRAANGHPITRAEVSHIASEESDLTGMGPIKSGSAATAQSIRDRQQNYVEMAGDVARKPAGEITKEDAAHVAEGRGEHLHRARAMGGKPVKGGSIAANLQSVADGNAKS
ncbi:hypothetical protein ACO1O0_002090 [Amphichorda felina]